jgi:SAM-dependent methyltransferase
VGCGSRPGGDVNVDCFTRGWNSQEGDQKQGEFMNPRLIPNFVVAHAEFLPFKDECFDLAFSSHTIEHVKNPLKMMQELLRVSKRQVTVRCPHRKGSGAKRPFHINYLDEKWFNVSLTKLGFRPKTVITNAECLITSRLLLHSAVHCPKRLLPYVEASIPYRIVRKCERSAIRFRFPFEIEVQVIKQTCQKHG